MTIVMPGERTFLDIEPWVREIRSVFGGGFYVGLHRVHRLVDDLRRRYPGRKVLMRMLDSL